MDDKMKRDDGFPQPNDSQQEGWNTESSGGADSGAQDGWNTEPSGGADSGAQDGWNTESSGGADSGAQDGWNTEPRTPYQTPVRTDVSDGGQTYHTYQEWQEQNGFEKQKAPGKKKRRKLWFMIGGAVAACAIFVGGAFAGGLFSGQSGGTVAAGTNSTKLTISETKASSTTASSGTVLTGEQVYAKAAPSVVSIEATSLSTQGKDSGSGVIMSKDGYVITNAHVVSGADLVNVVTSDGMQYKAKIVGSDTKTDLAVLKISANKTFTPAEFGDSSKLKAGETAYAIGSPGGVELANSITTGSISAINRDITINDRVMTLIQTDASINPGNSGGALINKYGQVIGITSAKLGISYYEGLGFAIPIDTAKEVVDQLIAYGYVPGRPAIGVTGYNISQQTAAYNNVPQGVLITEVDPKSDAAKRGLQAKDIITGVNGKTITTMDEINKAKEQLKAGDSIKLTIYRISTGKTMNITIKLVDENSLSSGSTKTTTQDNSGSSDGSSSGSDGSSYSFGGGSDDSGSSSGSGSDGSSSFTFPWSY